MRIQQSGRAGVSAPAKRGTKTGASGGFQVQTPAASASPAKTAAPARAGSIDAILTLQEVPDSMSGRRKALRKGHDILDTLELMKLELLSGQVSRSRAEALLRVVESRAGTDDEEVSAVLAEIELRARVELAKLGL